MPTDRELIEIVTVANMAGVKEAKAGFLSMNPALLAAGVALAIFVKISKDAIENTKSQDEAFLSLTQAVDAYNANLGKNKAAVTHYVAGTAASVKQTNSLKDAQDRIKLATDHVTLAEMALNEQMNKKKVNADAVAKAQIRLRDAQIRLTEAERSAGTVTLGTAGHYVTVAATHRLAAISLEDYRKRVEAFIVTNQGYIKNQYDVVQAAAAVVRAGHTEKESLRMLNDALDIAVVKHEDVSEAALSLIKVLAGNSKALKEVGITTAQYTAIMKKHESQAKKNAEILALIEKHYKDGKQGVDEITQSQNKLTIAWQTFTTNQGPNMTKLLKAVTDDAAELVGWLDLITQFFEKGGANSWGKMFLNWLSGGRIGTTGAGTHGSGAIAGSSGGMGSARTPIQIHIHGGMFMDHGPTIDAMANAIGRRLASTPGS